MELRGWGTNNDCPYMLMSYNCLEKLCDQTNQLQWSTCQIVKELRNYLTGSRNSTMKMFVFTHEWEHRDTNIG